MNTLSIASICIALALVPVVFIVPAYGEGILLTACILSSVSAVAFELSLT